MIPSHESKPKICRVVTVPTAAIQLQDQLNQLAEMGFDITLISSELDQYDSSGGTSLSQIPLDSRIKKIPLTIARNISIIQDLKSLFRLFIVFRKNQYDIVHSMTPKAGLLTAVAGFLARVPIRIHTFTGQRWVKLSGPLRVLLKTIDWFVGQLMTHLYADSPGQAKFLASQGISQKVIVLLQGSIAGVDLERFNSNKLAPRKNELRRKFGFSDNSFLTIFVGRLTADKGIPELVEAFEEFSNNKYNVKLILLGPTEPDLKTQNPDILKKIESNPNIHAFGFRSEVEEFVAMSDLMCLPSHREGFGGVVIQAAALGVPTIGTEIYALKDAIVDGETGVLVPVGDRERISSTMNELFNDRDKLKTMGESARIRAEKYFNSKVVNRAVADEYLKIFHELKLV